MDFLERAAKTSIQRLEQLDREINAQQQQQQQQQQQSNRDAREYSAKRVLPDEQLFLRTNELLEIREAQKRDLERILSKTLLTCLLYTSPSPRDMRRSRMPSSA